MKTKPIPAIVMLLGGAIACIFGMVYQYSVKHFITTLLIVLITFYVIGCIVKLILDKNFKEMEKAAEEEESEEVSEEEKENIESEDEDE